MSDDEVNSRERVLAAATAVFAQHGYDGATTRQIAKESGLNIATVAYHAGSKRDLYRLVMLRAYETEQAALSTAVDDFTATAISPETAVAAVRTLVRRYLDFCLDHPHIPALWMRRWLSDAADITELEATYARPLVDMVGRALADAVAAGHLDAGVDIEMALWSVLWAVHGFCCAGVLDDTGGRRGRTDPAAVDRFRAHLDDLVARLVATAMPARRTTWPLNH